MMVFWIRKMGWTSLFFGLSLIAVVSKASNIPLVELSKAGNEQLLGDVFLPGPPESIAEDKNIFYIACVGKALQPTAKDGDGFISKVSKEGKIIEANAFPEVKLDAPKGALIEDGVLYVTDVDRVVGIDLKTGKESQIIDLSPEKMVFLNDLAEGDDGILYASATDKDKIYAVNLKNKSYSELKTEYPLSGPNGLVYDDGVLYVAEYASKNGLSTGKIKSVDVKTGKVSNIVSEPGQYDGLQLEDGFLYFSDWDYGSEPGAVKKVNLKTGKTEIVTHVVAEGPADFIIEDGVLWLPSMMNSKVLRLKL